MKPKIMKKGDLVLVPFPLTDLSDRNLRPALVLSINQRDVIIAFISSNLDEKDTTDMILEPNSKNGLKKISLVKLAKIATIDNRLIIGKIGFIRGVYLKLLDKNLKQIFQL